MTLRSISDGEIALIKAMLNRGIKNKDIQFFFNRPDRPVNSGRITGIRDGDYGPSYKIEAATDTELDGFMAQFAGPATAVVATVPGEVVDPLSEIAIRKLFADQGDGTWRLTVGETDGHECKTSFGMKYAHNWLRGIAALANNSGGYIFFGVNDKGVSGPAGEDLSHAVVGMGTDEFQKVDPVTLAKRVKSVFDPTPRFRTSVIAIGGKSVGVIHVQRHESRPVIATKQDGDKISEGDIFYRYPGQSARIKYSDLRAMLDERDAEARAQMLPMVERLFQLGPKRSMVADLSEGVLKDGKMAIQIDKGLVDTLTFIKEGEFDEVDGAPTLRLIGDVKAVDGGIVVKNEVGLVTRAGLLETFLLQEQPSDPKRYIRFAVEVGQGEWLPLHYFAKLAGMSRSELIAFIDGCNGSTARKVTYKARAQCGATYKDAVGKPKAILDRIHVGDWPVLTTAQEASHFAQAVIALPHGSTCDRAPTLSLLMKSLTLADKSSVSFVRRAICRVDELLFGEVTPV